jgi:hypothetical protein
VIGLKLSAAAAAGLSGALRSGAPARML